MLLEAAVWEAGSLKSTCDSGPFEIPDLVFPYPVENRGKLSPSEDTYQPVLV